MSEPIRSLDRITIPKPCDADWDEMIGNDQVRFCEHCSLHVTNLSSMTRPEAMRFVAKSRGRLCVRFIETPLGDVLAEGPEKLHRISKRVSRVATGAFSATLSIASAVAQNTTPTQPSQPLSIAGVITPPRQVGAVINGTVTDPVGALVSGAVVTLTNAKAQQAFIYSTTDDGTYEFSSLEPGKYTLAIESPGFAKADLPEVEVKGEEKIKRNIELALPVLVEQVEVQMDKSIELTMTMGVVAFVEPKDPLALAAYKQDLDAVKQLVYVSLDINRRDENSSMTALEHAIEGSNLEIVRTLIMAGARADTKDDSGRTPLMRLGDKASPELVRELLSAGARVNDRDETGNTALMYAASSNSPAVIKELIDNGAKVDFKDQESKTALMFAATDGENGPANAKLLIDAGARVNDKDTSGKTPLMMAGEEGDPETLKLLLSHGAEVNEKDNEGNTALMLVAGTTDDESLLALLNAGADMTFRNAEGKTALGIAREADHHEIVKLLEARGAPE
ncbi:MAG TPA: ankyrin repeat domain-containing protein [Pyrinomonadaceae bacterium]|nr:ankyrin repeat domain-containing protein [Pyrinomonadaceae bacterium]